jgi:hypothetical protein
MKSHKRHKEKDGDREKHRSTDREKVKRYSYDDRSDIKESDNRGIRGVDEVKNERYERNDKLGEPWRSDKGGNNNERRHEKGDKGSVIEKSFNFRDSKGRECNDEYYQRKAPGHHDQVRTMNHGDIVRKSSKEDGRKEMIDSNRVRDSERYSRRDIDDRKHDREWLVEASAEKSVNKHSGKAEDDRFQRGRPFSFSETEHSRDHHQYARVNDVRESIRVRENFSHSQHDDRRYTGQRDPFERRGMPSYERSFPPPHIEERWKRDEAISSHAFGRDGPLTEGDRRRDRDFNERPFDRRSNDERAPYKR